MSLTIKQYWVRMLLSFAELLAVSVISFVLIDAQNAELPNASQLSQTLAIVFFLLMIINAIAVIIYLLITILRRARNTGYAVPFFLVGVFVPFGFVVVGCIPSATRKS